MTAVVSAESLTNALVRSKRSRICHWLWRLRTITGFSGPMALTRRRRNGWSCGPAAPTSGRHTLGGYGCIAEPGTGWIMPKVLPSVSLA